MNWLVTAYSTKMDGLCYVVEADTGFDACNKVAKLEGYLFQQIEYGSHENDCKGVVDIFYHPESDMKAIVRAYANGDGPRYCYEVFYEPVTLNYNLRGAVCW